MLNKDEWYHKYYSPENEQVLRMLSKMRHGELLIKIHEKKPVELTPSYSLRINNDANRQSALIAGDNIEKDHKMRDI